MLFQIKEDVFVERGDILVAYTEEKIKGELWSVFQVLIIL